MPAPTCPKCASAVESGAKFCGVCGHRLLPGPPLDPLATTTTGSYGQPAEPRVAGADAVKASPAAAPPPDPKPAAAPATRPAAHAPAPKFVAPAAAVKPAPALEMDAEPPPAAERPRTRPRSVDALVGLTLNNRYQVLRKLGEGGFGAVFAGKQLATGREVALKILHPQNVSDATVVARFRREAEACSLLRNPHTVTIYDFDETEDGTLYLAMELVRGKSLQQLQKSDGVLEPLRVLRILDQVADALAEAHDKGIVHRDMKPENVMVETRDGEDFVKVLDFGIAKIVSGEGAKNAMALTAIGQTVGTLEFMSPEQLRGQPLDGRSDIYALGMMAYEMLTGTLPFQNAKNTTEVIQFHLQGAPPPPSTLNAEAAIPPPVDEIVLKMVAKTREARHENASTLRGHIREVLARADAGAHKREALRLAAVIGGIALVVLLIVLLAR